MPGKEEKRRTKYSKAQILEEWEKIKDAPNEELTYSYARKNYLWWCPASRLYGKNSTDWYGFLAAMGKSEVEIKEIRKTKPKKRSSRFTNEEILAKWNEIKDAPDEQLTNTFARENYEWWGCASNLYGGYSTDWYGFLRAMGKTEEEIAGIKKVAKNPSIEALRKRQLKFSKKTILDKWKGIKDAPDEELTYSYAIKNYAWWSSACSHFTERNNDWYGFLKAMGKSNEGIQMIRDVGKKIASQNIRETRLKFSREEVLAEWEGIKKAPDKELTFIFAKEKYGWFSSACTNFGGPKRNWYVFLKAMGKSDEEIDRIKKVAKSRIGSGTKIPKEKIDLEWEKIKDAPDEELTYIYARKNYGWWISACSYYGKNSTDWYGFLAAKEKSEEEIKRIRYAGVKARLDKRKVSISRDKEVEGAMPKKIMGKKFTKEEILAEWEKVKDKPDSELTYAYARKNYEWWSLACNYYGGSSSDWYGFLTAMGKSEGEIQGVREAGKKSSANKCITSTSIKTSDGKTIVIVDTTNGNNGNGSGVDYSDAISTIRSPQTISTKTHSPKVVKFNLSLQEKSKGEKQQSMAEEIRRIIGAGVDWNDPELVRRYKEVFPQMAPWVVHRACALYLLGMAKSGKIEMPKNILSAASGPSEVHEAIADFKALFESQGSRIPTVFDLDLSMNMLLAGGNRTQSIGDVRRAGFKSGSFDMVENSSIFQFEPEDVKGIILESNRLIKEGGLLLLVSNGKRFSGSFYEGLTECGFELISDKDAMFSLDKPGKKLLEKAHGKRFSQKFGAAMGDSVFILAKKVSDANRDVDGGKFTFEGFDSAPPELREFMDEFKGFLRGLDSGDAEATTEHRRKAIDMFKDIGKKRPEIFREYSTVFCRAQEKFWSIVESPKYSDFESLEHLRDRSGHKEKIFPMVWRTLPSGRNRRPKPNAMHSM